MALPERLAADLDWLAHRPDGATAENLAYTPSLTQVLGHGNADIAIERLYKLASDFRHDRFVLADLARINIGVYAARITSRLTDYGMTVREQGYSYEQMLNWARAGRKTLVDWLFANSESVSKLSIRVTMTGPGTFQTAVSIVRTSSVNTIPSVMFWADNLFCHRIPDTPNRAQTIQRVAFDGDNARLIDIQAEDWEDYTIRATKEVRINASWALDHRVDFDFRTAGFEDVDTSLYSYGRYQLIYLTPTQQSGTWGSPNEESPHHEGAGSTSGCGHQF